VGPAYATPKSRGPGRESEKAEAAEGTIGVTPAILQFLPLPAVVSSKLEEEPLALGTGWAHNAGVKV
jgi:hypothetical protein